MFALIESCLNNQKQICSPVPSKSYQQSRHIPDPLEYLKTKQQSLEKQIKDLCLSMNDLQKQANNDNVSKQKILEKIKLLGVKSSLNIAEQGALAGEDIENILQPIVAMLIEKMPTFPIDTHWLEEKVSSIRALGFKRTLAQ